MEKSQLPNKKIASGWRRSFFWFHLGYGEDFEGLKIDPKKPLGLDEKTKGRGGVLQKHPSRENKWSSARFSSWRIWCLLLEKMHENPFISAFVIWITMMHVAKSVGLGCFFVTGKLGKIMECVLRMLLLEPKKLTKRELERKKSTVTT